MIPTNKASTGMGLTSLAASSSSTSSSSSSEGNNINNNVNNMMPTTVSTTTTTTAKRGAFIVFEGVDRCGKTTQTSLLVKHLLQLGLAAVAMRFPDRTTMVGSLIDQYLQSRSDLDDRAIHLLFSANRWEAVPTIRKHLLDDKATIVCDRYAYSGVAFSSSKPSLTDDLEWCKSCDVGLPAPDAVIFLHLTQEEAELRGGFGEERYENRDMQIRVRQRFSQLQAMDEMESGYSTDGDGKVPTWYIVNAAQSIDNVQKDINAIVEKTIDKVHKGDIPLGLLWTTPTPKTTAKGKMDGKENKEN